MIRIEIIERKNAKLRKRLVDAMRSGELRTFTAADRGRKVTHLRYPGQIRWTDKDGKISASLRGTRGEAPWQLLSAFLGRLSHKYPDKIESIRIEFAKTPRAGKTGKKRARR